MFKDSSTKGIVVVVSTDGGDSKALLDDIDTFGQFMIRVVGQLQGFPIADDTIARLLKGLTVFAQWRFRLIQYPTMTVIGVGQILVMGGKLIATTLSTFELC